jgi:acyl-CoA thioesterase YciA
MDDSDSPPDMEPAIRMVAMPADTNPSGDIFGGWIMSIMDMAGGNTAYQRAGGRVATVGVKEIAFRHPVRVGDVVSCYAEVVRVGRTSLDTRVSLWVQHDRQGKPVKVTEGVYSFVALDDEGRPRPVDQEQEQAQA